MDVFYLILYKIGEKNLFEESSYKSTNKNSSVLALILFNVKKPVSFFIVQLPNVQQNLSLKKELIIALLKEMKH